MRLHELSPRPGAKHRRKRLGCGESSGHGKTSGRGHKGQRARSGGSVRLGFEGGQMPLIRRLPKRGFNNTNFKPVFAVINLDTLEARFDSGATINESSLRDLGLVRGSFDGIKLLARGEITKSFTVEVHKSSLAAREKLEKVGGSLLLLPEKREMTARLPRGEERVARSRLSRRKKLEAKR
ncbi:MAG: 50S ribosomal protein L15 [Verrucomicrobia bacterium RIFCSPHIGHO2_12_FULL_41_10]|nr:MAG: 50S ribosomal protein L15 [Verrucomicrobia bacterium RIFCSPHIGHO2_12_FULL_41_10]